MAYIVIHSSDPWLLARMATDLECEEYRLCKLNQQYQHPFDDGCFQFEWLQISDSWFNFHNHECFGLPTRYELTSRNYLTVLEAVLKAKDDG